MINIKSAYASAAPEINSLEDIVKLLDEYGEINFLIGKVYNCKSLNIRSTVSESMSDDSEYEPEIAAVINKGHRVIVIPEIVTDDYYSIVTYVDDVGIVYGYCLKKYIYVDITDFIFKKLSFMGDIDEKSNEIAEELAMKAPIRNPEFTGSISMGRKYKSSVGGNSVALGSGNTASNINSVALGCNNTASGGHSLASGCNNTVSGGYSLASGRNNTVSGGYSAVLGGYCNTVSGDYSAVLGGYCNTVSGDYQTVIGIRNKPDTESLFIIGGGGEGNSADLRNIHTVDRSGNAMYAGTVESKAIILLSTTSSKKFKITVDDTGTLTATEVTE